MQRAITVSTLAAFVLVTTAAALPPLQPKAGQPLPDLSPQQRTQFQLGLEAYQHEFTQAEGLGPAFNATSCASCHEVPVGGWGVAKVQHFGRLEADGTFNFLTELGGPVRQRLPLTGPCSEALPAQANHVRMRVTPSVLAFGLVEALTDAQLAANADPNDANGDGISGRVHMVRPLEAPAGSPLRVGRFGWKAQIATVLSFSGDAGRTEMGITNRIVRDETVPGGGSVPPSGCDTTADPEDRPAPDGLAFVDSITSFQRYLAPPPQTPKTGMLGEALFHSIGCAKCHTASFTTPNDSAIEAALRNKTIRPYSDFLLHDMGDGEADGIGDGIPDGDAGRFEMKTPPLWNLRTRPVMLHDGRADESTFDGRVDRAISHHGGEASASRDQFNQLSPLNKAALRRFLASLGRDEFDVDGDGSVGGDDFARLLSRGSLQNVSPEEDAAAADVNANGAIDADELAFLAARAGIDTDCNQNNILDHLEIFNGTSRDADSNGRPDECDALLCSQRVVRITASGGAIPDASSSSTGFIGVIPSSALPEPGFIDRVAVGINVTHTWLSDVRATLQRGTDSPKSVVGEICPSCDRFAADLNGLYWFRSGTDVVVPCLADSSFVINPANPNCETRASLLPGVFKASAAAWFGASSLQSQASWTLRVFDQRAGDVGTVHSWTLDIVYRPTNFADCNENGADDTCDIQNQNSADEDLNGVPDSCQIAQNPALDCNLNNRLDAAEVALGVAPDCNQNARPDSCELDSDGDGTIDACDQCPNNAPLVVETACGCAPATDTDSDGTPDCIDLCPSNPSKIAPGICGCLLPDTDGDGDGTPDCNDGCPNDPAKLAAGVCGCGVPDTDTDGDGRKDCQDNCPTVANADQADCDSDGVGDLCTTNALDCNDNGRPDACDIASGASGDANQDGVPDECAADCNGNGVADSIDIANGTASDCNGNARPDSCDIAAGTSSDHNGNGRPDECSGEFVVGGTGFATIQAAVNAASTGTVILIAPGTYPPVDLASKSVTLRAIGDLGSVIIDGQHTSPCVKMFNIVGIPPILERLKLLNGHGESGGGLSIGLASPFVQNCIVENCSATTWGGGIMLNGSAAILRNCTITGCSAARGGGIAVAGFNPAGAARIQGCTIQTNTASTSGGGVYTKAGLIIRESPSNLAPTLMLGNSAPLGGGVHFDPVGSAQMGSTRFCLNTFAAVEGSYLDLSGNLFGQDCNANGQCDSDEIAAAPSLDCNQSGVLDSCEIAAGLEADCNENEKIDSCDIASGSSPDGDGDGVPDECSSDCNSNGIPDSTEIANGSTPDCNGNLRPDSCDLALGTSTDLDGNGRLDECGGEWIVGGSGFPTLAAAMSAAPNDTTIRVGPGTYTGALLLTSKRLTIRSISGPAVTVLSGAQLATSILTVRTASTAGSVIEGFTFRDGPTGTADLDTWVGGAIYLSNTTVSILNCRFIDNRALGIGGAIYALNTSGLIENCLFEGNSAIEGAAAVHYGFGGNINVRSSTFLSNHSLGAAGALAFVQWFEGPLTTATVSDSVFRGNSAQDSAGALFWYAAAGSNLRITGCLFESNLGPDGAVVKTTESGETPLQFEFVGSRFCLNTPANVVGPYVDLGGNTFSGDCNQNGVCDADEIATGSGSDCNANGLLDACDLAAGSATDCNGNGRPDLCDINLGFSTDLDADGVLDECAGQLVVGGSGFATIQAAMAAAAPSSTIRVGPGTYTGHILISSKPLKLVSIAGPQATVLSGSGLDASVMRIRGAAASGTEIDGFTFRDGPIGTLEFGFRLGGGLFLQSTQAVVRNCQFVDNHAAYGGGIYSYDSSGTIENCLFDGNSADEDAGAVQIGFGGTMLFRNNILIGNSCQRNGGAMQVAYWFEGPITSTAIEGCVFVGNESLGSGGAVAWYAGLGGDLAISDCSFDSNSGAEAACARLTNSPSATSAFALRDSRFCRNSPRNVFGASRDLGGNTFSQDCNANGLCDADEIASGLVPDCDHDGIPDPCEVGRLIAWGQGGDGQTVPPASLGSPRAISAGCNHAIAIRADRTVAAWGANVHGQGVVPSSIGAVTAIAAGCDHNLALRTNGTLAAWGRNNFGQTLIPSAANGNVAEIAAGMSHSGVRKTNGTLVLWGRNVEGQLNVPGTLGIAAKLALGGAHSVAMRPNGTVLCWGQNSSGQCTPPANMGSLASIAAGLTHTVGLRANGTVVAWGSNSFGESTVPAGLADVVAIQAGSGHHTLALLSDGAVFGWGRNDFTQASAVTGTEDSRMVAAGGNFSIAVTRSADDCDNNSVIDSCELSSGSAADCNHNGAIDACDIEGGSAADCDGDGIPNSCEISGGQTTDLNGNGLPDNCEFVVGGSGFSSIQAAINSAASGSTIVVAPGTYSGTPISFGDKQIKLRSIAGANSTILDGAGLSAPIIAISSSLSNGSEIVGFTFRNAQRGGAGSTAQGGAISASGTGQLGFLQLTIASCIFENNSAASGGAIYAQQLLGKIEACDFRNNTAQLGGSIFTRRGIWEIRNCAINTSSAVLGGGIYSEAPISGIIMDTVLQQNTADAGSAFYWKQLETTGPVTVSGSAVESNSGPAGQVSAAVTLDAPPSVPAVQLPITNSFICLNTPRNFVGPVVVDAATTVSGDCDDNGVCDVEDIANGAPDSNNNGVIDACETAVGDLNGDGAVNSQDIAQILALWGSSNNAADLNDDGVVGSADLAILLANWTF